MMNDKIYAHITAVSGYVPPDVLSNQDLEKMVDTSDEWIHTRTGIRERRILKGAGLGTSDLAAPVARDLCRQKDYDPEEIDCIIVATTTPDFFFPSTSNIVADKIGAKNSWSFDMSAACSGFLFGLSVGTSLIESGRYKKVILIGADKMSAITEYTNRNTCILFGDAAGGVLLEPSTEEGGLLNAIHKTDGIGKNYLYMKGGGSVMPASEESVRQKYHYIHQEGKIVFKYAVNYMSGVIEELMQKNGLSIEDVAFIVPHQANIRILNAISERINIPKEKILINLQKHGNTSAATIPLCLWECHKRFKKGDNLILASFGAGFTWGSSWVKWTL